MDDLERYLGASGLTSALLSQLGQAETIVVATIRQKQLQLLRPATTDHGPQDGGYTVLKAPTVIIDRRWSPEERERAARSEDQRLVAAADDERFGVAEQLAAGPVLQQAWQAGKDDGHARGYAMVAAAVDLARVGLASSLTREQIAQAHTTYLPVPPPLPEEAERAWEWATQVRSGVAALLVPADHHGRRWRAFDYLTTETPIPETTWRTALGLATDEDHYGIGLTAEFEGEFDIAEAAWRPLAAIGHTPAMNKLGLLLSHLGDTQEAENWLREAAEAGDVSAMYNLGTMLVVEDRVEEGEQRWRMAAEAGEKLAMIKLGWFLATQGRLEEAAFWFRRSAEEGTPVALFNLGYLLAKVGRIEESEQWYRKVVEGSRDFSSDDLLFLWRYALDREDMEHRFQQAAEEGKIGAMFILGNLLSLQGRKREAEKWWERGKKEL
ncbi:sel1 repeat family protein [Nocardiopsis sp. ARC36]